MKKILPLILLTGLLFLPWFDYASASKAETSDASYYSSSPTSHSAKMTTYIHFMKAAHAGDSETANQVATDDVTWDLDAGSEVSNGLPWIGLFKGKKAIAEAAQKMKGIQVLSRKYYLISENKTQLIMVAMDTIKWKGMVIPNINFANVITFRGNKISYIKTVEDSARPLKAYESYQAYQSVKNWSAKNKE